MDQRTVNDSPLVLITGGLNIPGDIFVSEPNWRAKASLEAGDGGRESAFGRLSPGHGASPTALAVPADQTWARNSNLRNTHLPASAYLALLEAVVLEEMPEPRSQLSKGSKRLNRPWVTSTENKKGTKDRL